MAAEPDRLVIDIADNGTGLPDQPARLFEPYVTHRAKGTGLGLPIVKKIIEEHDGTLELMPAPAVRGQRRPRRLRPHRAAAGAARARVPRREEQDHRKVEGEHVMTDILVVDDEPDIRSLIGDILEDEGHGVRLAWDSDTALAAIDAAPPDLVILDIWLKDSRLDGIDILKRVKRDNPAIPIVIISGHGNIEIAVAAIKQGAYDFIEKPFNIDQLMVVIGRALETSRLRRENAALKVRDGGRTKLVGASPAFRQMKNQLDKVARTNSRVMLTGPAGAGKEEAARYLHRNSERAKGPFVTVNSASIAPDAMEEVLFGRESPERGVEPGLFERAHTGILFFDEVADMPPGTQSKILRVLVDQSFQRAGGAEHRARRRPRDLRDHPRPRPRGAGRPLPHRALPPAERRAGRRPRPRGAARGHPRARPAPSSTSSTPPRACRRAASRPRPRRSCRPCAGPATSASSATRWSGR